MKTDRFDGGSVIVWGSITHGLKTPLIVINGNLNAIQYREFSVKRGSVCAAAQADISTR